MVLPTCLNCSKLPTINLKICVMNKYLLSLALFFLVFVLSAQDVIYTVSGELNNEKVSLDSILVENLTNKTWITFSNLPDELYYQINLTKKSYWGTTDVNSFQNNFSGFIESQNMPGEITLTYNNSVPTEARISVFNINGQRIYSSNKQIIIPGNSVQVKLAETGVYLIRVESDFGTQSFKGIGLPKVNSYNVSVIDKSNFNIQTKSSQITFESDFEYTIGDSIRISVYKNVNYAVPATLEIINSDALNFIFQTNSDTTEIISGRINLENVSNLNISELSVQSINNTAPIKTNGTFQIVNEEKDVEEFPLLVLVNDEVLFGYYPSSVADNNVSVDAILLFYLKLHPDIANQGFTDSNILEALKADANYSNLKNLIVASLDSGTSPVDNENFVNLYFESSKSIAAYLINNQEKSTSIYSSEEDFIFKFNFSRDGKIEWDKSSKLFAVLGVEIMDVKENKVVFHSQLEPKSIIISVESLIPFVVGEVVIFLNDLLTGENSDIRTFNFPKEGEYSISFTNGNNGLTTPEFQQKIKSRNAELLAFKMLTSAMPIGLKRLISNDKCWEGVAGLVSILHNTFVEMAGSETYSHTQIPAIFYSLQKDGYELAKDCLGKNFTFWDKIGGILKKLEPLGNAENLSNIIFMSRDYFGSEITGKQTRYFYEGLSFGKLDYKKVTDNEFEGESGSYHQYGGKVKEEITQYNIEVGLTERKFVPQVEMLPAGGLPFYASLISGDATLNESSNLMSSTEGLIFLDLIMGEEEISKVKIEPDFKVDLPYIKPDTITLIKSSNTFTDSRDGQTYKTTKIGNQTWMAENLNYNVGNGSYCYNNNSANCAIYGKLYIWEAAKTACPTGWHLPTDDEWKQLEMAIGMSQSEADGIGWRGTNEGTKLKATSGWYNNGNGTDDYGFSGLPGGSRSGNGVFFDVTYGGIWWSAAEYSTSHAWSRRVDYTGTSLNRGNYYKEFVFSVRCVRD